MTTLSQSQAGADAFCAGTFFSYGLCHLVAAGLGAIVMMGLVWLGLRWRATRRERLLVGLWAWSTMAWQAYTVVWWLLPANYDVTKSLSLHLCDIAAWIAPIALLTNSRPMRALLYFWGIGLSTQAFFTPTLQDGASHMHFWFFWIGHTQIVGSALYDLVVRRYRPAWRDFVVGVGLSMIYVAVVVSVDLTVGANYGYLGRSLPDRPTLLDALGPWPWRAIWLVLIGIALMAVMTAVWPRSMRTRAEPLPPQQAE